MTELLAKFAPIVVDITIVFFLVYLTLLLIRGTRTVPMALGLLVIVIIYQLSQQLGLATTYMVLDQFMAVAVIFALIIFQDDIRRALVRMGKFAWFTTGQESHVMEEVVKAAANLASKNIGAIIVFERDASLAEFIESGTNIDAAVTKELLYTIFIPRMQNPLHDGAVIIKNYRVSQAGVLLPLSGNPRLDKTLGTRHRAALGITEDTDAVSIVVSEERGTISLCFGGLITKNLDLGSLRKALNGLFSKERAREREKAAEERKSRAPKPPVQKVHKLTDEQPATTANEAETSTSTNGDVVDSSTTSPSIDESGESNEVERVSIVGEILDDRGTESSTAADESNGGTIKGS